MIEAHWEFVWAAYGFAWLAAGGYAVSLWRRSK